MSLTRRRFLKTGLAAGSIAALPASLYRGAFAAQPPSERVRTAMIGVGNQGGPNNNLKYFLKNVVAVCDVDKNYLQRAVDFVEKGTKAKPAEYSDFRKVLDAKDVDAVVVTVPDQWHAYMTIMACRAGKDVYCEKPLSLTISEGQKMVAVARDTKRVVQTGSQQRSGLEFARAMQLLREGAVGKIQSVNVTLPGPNWVERVKGPVPDSAPPPELDFDMWLGPAPQRPYNKHRVHYAFRFFWDYSGGQMTNFGAHHLDIAQQGLGMDDSGPVRVEGTATFHPEKWYETPDAATVKYTYANGVILNCLQKPGVPGGEQGTEFVGEKGKLFVTRGKVSGVASFTPPKGEPSNNVRHVANFFDCVKTRKYPAADVAIGHRSATVCHLGNIAIRTGKTIAWDPVKEQIVGDPEAAKWLSREYRKPWALA